MVLQFKFLMGKLKGEIPKPRGLLADSWAFQEPVVAIAKSTRGTHFL